MTRVSWGSLGFIAWVALFELSGVSRGELLTFDYSGSVAMGGGTTFGVPIDAAATVTGQLKVETSAAMTHDFGNGRVGYQQSLVGGLAATFDDAGTQTTFAADEYLVIIGNDVDLDGFFVDSVEFLYSCELEPRLTKLMTVNGEPRTAGDYDQNGKSDLLDYAKWKADFGSIGGTADGNDNGYVDAADYTLWRDGGPTGFFTVVFQSFETSVFESTSLADANLANNLTPLNFVSFFNPLGDTPIYPDVLFDVPNFAVAGVGAIQSPEPSACWLFGFSAALLGLHRTRPSTKAFFGCH